MAEFNLQTLPIASIRENEVSLRSLNRENEKYQGLVASVRAKGFVGAIIVMPAREQEGETAETVDGLYDIIDGLHRFNAAKDNGLTEIACDVQPQMSQEEAMQMQLMANTHKIETKPVEYTQHIQRLFNLNPTLTLSELAAQLGVTTTWINSRLGLLKLSEPIQALVDDSKITLTNAFALAKLPPEEQEAFIERAMTMAPGQFSPAIAARKKELAEARRQGRVAGEEEFTPTSYMQKKTDLEIERNSLTVIGTLIDQAGVSTALEGAKIALDWTLNLDAMSVAVQKDKFDSRKAKAKDAAEKRKLDRAKKKEAEALAEQLKITNAQVM